MVKTQSATTIRYRKLAHEFRQRLGGKCVKCGFADERALQFDHIQAIGRKRPMGWAHYKHLGEAIIAGKIQLLCANCNQIKRHEVGSRELGGKITWRNREVMEERLAVLIERLCSVDFKVPENRRAFKRHTANTISPIAQQVLRVVGLPLSGSEMAYCLEAFGWEFGSGKKEYTMGSMICRTAMGRRPDIFVLGEGGRFSLKAKAPNLLKEQITCKKCGYVWIPKAGWPPRSCAQCKRNWRVS